MQNVNVFVYIQDVLHRMMTHPSSRIDELTPRNWKAIRTTTPEHGVAAAAE